MSAMVHFCFYSNFMYKNLPLPVFDEGLPRMY